MLLLSCVFDLFVDWCAFLLACPRVCLFMCVWLVLPTSTGCVFVSLMLVKSMSVNSLSRSESNCYTFLFVCLCDVIFSNSTHSALACLRAFVCFVSIDQITSSDHKPIHAAFNVKLTPEVWLCDTIRFFWGVCLSPAVLLLYCTVLYCTWCVFSLKPLGFGHGPPAHPPLSTVTD